MQIKSEETEHSPLGASSSHRWFECPASIPLSEGVASTSSPFAELGTAAHTLGDKCLQENKNAQDFIGWKIDKFIVDDEMADAVQVYLDTIRKFVTSNTKLFSESKIKLSWIDPRLFGTNDAMVLDEENNILYLFDYKHGQGVKVEAKDNEQLLYYALGAARNYFGIKVIAHIVQPRNFGSEGPVRSWEISFDQLTEFEEKLKEKVALVDKASKDRKNIYDYAKAGEHCKFCKAAKFCKKLRDNALEVAGMDFEAILSKSIPIEPHSLTPEQIAKTLTLAPMLEEWISAVKSYAYEEMNRGIDIPGYKIVDKRPRRKWVDESKVREELTWIYGESIFKERVLKSPAQLEKIAPKKVISQFTVSESSGYNIAPNTDSREKKIPYADDFASILNS